MPRALIGLGANLGERADTLAAAVDELRRTPDVAVLAVSRWHETQPVGGPPGQPSFLNGAMLLETELAPSAVLALLHKIEAQFGRRRDEHWGPRTLDLDLLLYGDQHIELPELVVPHPRMAFRRFVLEPATEIAPDMVHPATGRTISQLLAELLATERSTR